MLQRPNESDQAVAAPLRITALDRARTFITLLVVLHHSVVNYTHFGSGDRMRWLGFDLVVLFNDSFFMACMFFISGLFVRDSLARRGSTNFLGHRAFRLGMPFLISILPFENKSPSTPSWPSSLIWSSASIRYGVT